MYATCVMEANRLVNSQFITKLRAVDGHIIVRVSSGGDEFSVIVTENTNDADEGNGGSVPLRVGCG